MNTIARLFTALIAASAFVLPASAMAETKAHKADGFPMKAEVYRKLADAKIEQMKSHIDHGLSAHSFTPDHKAEVQKSADEAIKELHTALDKVGADGVVTRDEAKEIRDLGQKLRTKLRGELKGKHAKAKAKGAKPAKGKAHAPKAKAPAKKAEPAKDK